MLILGIKVSVLWTQEEVVVGSSFHSFVEEALLEYPHQGLGSQTCKTVGTQFGPKGLLLRGRKGEREGDREREREERETKEAQRRGRLRKPEQRQVMDPDSGE